MPIRILLADDNGPVRAAMRQVLGSIDEHWEFAEAENGQEAVKAALDLKPNLVVMDLAMPVMNGLAATRQITKFLPETAVLMHTLYWSPEIELEAGKAGVRKAVPKSDSKVLVSAVEEVLHSELSEVIEAFPKLVSLDTPTGTRRRTEDKVRELCAQLIASKHDEVQEPLLIELQHILHQHVENLRTRVAEYRVIPERRDRTGTQSPDTPVEES